MKNLIALLSAGALLVGICFGAYYAWHWVGDVFGALEEPTRQSLIAFTIIVVFVAVILIAGIRSGQAREGNRRDRSEIYRKLIVAWAANASGTGSPDERAEAERQLAICGTPGVIRKYRAARDADPGQPEGQARIEALILEMRRDLGHSRFGFQSGELAALVGGATVARDHGDR